jgi:hypothetical protein
MAPNIAKNYINVQKKNYDGFVVIGAGLPRTGTMSLRTGLQHILDGACYHMADVVVGSTEVITMGRKNIEKHNFSHLFELFGQNHIFKHFHKNITYFVLFA